MTIPPSSTDSLLNIYLALSQYPILAGRIRVFMRRELFERGVIKPGAFETEVHEKAILSQEREGLHNPYIDEPADIWERRLAAVRDQLTDFYFSHFLPFDVFEKLLAELLSERGISQQNLMLSINPETAPQDMVFEQAMTIERMPSSERTRFEARLRELKVVLIRSMISDQLRYINIAKEWFTISDLANIRRRKIGAGRIGGKAAGMLLAERILKETADESLRNNLMTPESFFIGSDVMYTFMTINNLVHWNDQKYKDEDQMRAEYPLIVKDFEEGEFSPEILERFQNLLITIGQKPIIVRSSSLLEDNFGASFAGKYDSIFCPNQGTLKENLKHLTRSIARVFASTLNPPALLYRRRRGLLDYDERMAILMQVVEGEEVGSYYFPQLSGVAFSQNQYRWAPQIRREDGFIRLVWGLGTRAVDRVGNDYPRLIALSHPLLRPSSAAKAIRRYSQQYIDLIDLEHNAFRTLPVHEVISARYPPLRYLVQLDQDGYFSSLRSAFLDGNTSDLILTFEELLKRTAFAERMRSLLHLLEKSYHSPVDVEFTARLVNPEGLHPEIQITLVQCRPQSRLQEADEVRLPALLPEKNVIFSTHFMVPQGNVTDIRYVVFVSPESYFSIPTANDRFALERAIGKLNASLAGEKYICVGPGRWGTTNPDLGIHIDYADIYNCKALIEIAGQGVGAAPEPSLGTHFFQDLLEAEIYPLAISIDDPESVFNHDFFYNTPNALHDWLRGDDKLCEYLRLIEVNAYRPGYSLSLTMNDEKGLAIAYLVAGGAQPAEKGKAAAENGSGRVTD
jgi:hypothetical protein